MFPKYLVFYKKVQKQLQNFQEKMNIFGFCTNYIEKEPEKIAEFLKQAFFKTS